MHQCNFKVNFRRNSNFKNYNTVFLRLLQNRNFLEVLKVPKTHHLKVNKFFKNSYYKSAENVD